jgi:hypothetical protein
MDSWMSDRELAADLIKNGSAWDFDRADLWFENGIMDPKEMSAFGQLVNQGILDLASRESQDSLLHQQPGGDLALYLAVDLFAYQQGGKPHRSLPARDHACVGALRRLPHVVQ